MRQSLRKLLLRVVTSAVLASSLTGCLNGSGGFLANPNSLFGFEEAAGPAQSGPISVEELLARARLSESDVSASLPTAQVERGAAGMDGSAYIALGTFLKELEPLMHDRVVVTRPTSDESGLEETRFAVEVGRLIERAGFAVEFQVSPVQPAGLLTLRVAEGA